MTSVAGFQYRRTLEDLYREGDPEIPLHFDDHAGIQAINSVFYRRNQEELGDSADAVVLAQYKALQHRRFAGRTGMTEDDSRMLEDRRAPPPSVPAPAAVPRAALGGMEIATPVAFDSEFDEVQPGDAAHPVVAPAMAEAAEAHGAMVSRRAQFAQAAGTGLSRIGGAAESIINHSAAAMRLIPTAAGHSLAASRSMASMAAGPSSTALALIPAAAGASASAMRQLPALAAGPSSAALQLLPAAAGYSANAMRQLPALADSAMRRVGTEMLTEAGIWGDAVGSVIGPGGRPAGIAADALMLGAHQASRNQGEYNGYARAAWNAATPIANLLVDWLLHPPAPAMRAPEPIYTPIYFATAPSGAASSSSAPALADTGMPYPGWGTGPAYAKPAGSRPALPTTMHPPAILAPPPARATSYAKAVAASKSKSTAPLGPRPVRAAASKSTVPTGPRG